MDVVQSPLTRPRWARMWREFARNLNIGRRVPDLFDSAWYLHQYPDIRASGMAPYQHWVRHGAFEGRNPHPLFDTEWYIKKYGESLKNKINPLDHFIRNCRWGEYDPHPLFSTKWYLSQNVRLDIRDGRHEDLLSHFIAEGWRQGRNPHPLFDVKYYCSQVEDFEGSNMDPLTHYVTIGWRKGLRPHEIFDPAWYLTVHGDVRETGVEPLSHYLRCGWLENRRPVPMFNPDIYRKAYGVSAALNPLIDYVVNDREATFAQRSSDLNEWRSNISLSDPGNVEIARPIGIFIHVQSDRNLHEFSSYLARIELPMRIYVTTPNERNKKQIIGFFGEYDAGLEIAIVPKVGEAIAPFLIELKDKFRQHDICLRLHASEGGSAAIEAEEQRRRLLDDLIGSPARTRSIVNAFLKDPSLGLVVAQPWAGPVNKSGEDRFVCRMIAMLGLDIAIVQERANEGASTFWFRPQALSSLLALDLHWTDFHEARHNSSSQLSMNAIEQSFLHLCIKSHYKWAILPGIWDEYKLTYDGIARLLKQADAFDADYYCKTYPDIAEAGVDPLEHWINTGVREGRDPSAWFKTGYYMRVIHANWQAGVNPLVHYLLEGKALGLPTQPTERVKAFIEVDDLYAHYARAEAQSDYVGETQPRIRPTDVRLIAFYLPQFHAFAENDRFWGRGFTEWTNTSKAIPQFKGHYQPRLPGELGFYDVRLKSVLARQIELAKQYGVHGWCLHHYFFDGKPVMHTVFDTLLANPNLDIPFCLHWANEPWTVRFDGLSTKKGVLLDQKHSAEDDLAFFDSIEPALRDPRYIRIDGRPLLIIYRPSLFPDISATVARWRECCRKKGIDDLYLAVMQTAFEGNIDPRDYGFDAAIEFPPHNYPVSDVSHRVKFYDPGSPLGIYDYEHVVDRALARPQTEYRLFRGLMPSWDNTPRRINSGVYVNCEPHRYQRWLEALCKQTDDVRHRDEKLIFINAWNEWAEGAYLEPDRKYGYAYLNATAQALNAYRPIDIDRLGLRILVIAHIFYTDLLDEFVAHFCNVPGKFDLLITTYQGGAPIVSRYLKERMPNFRDEVKIIEAPNAGFDFGPFVLNALPEAMKFDVCCKIHSKKTPYNSTFGGWREYLLRNILGSPESIADILEEFKNDPKLGLLYPKTYPPVEPHVEWGSNYKITSDLLKKLGISSNEETIVRFPAGSMFWFRPDALAPLLSLNLTVEDFRRSTNGARDASGTAIIDGTLAHALERTIGYVAQSAGYRSRETLFSR